MDELPPHPDPVPGSVPEGSQSEPPSHSVPVREGLVEDLSPLPVPVPEGCEDTPSPPAGSRRIRRRSPQPRRRSRRSSHPVLLIAYPYVAGLLIACPYIAGPLIAGSAA
ncbi:hypothetical protein CRENBAI_019065 [Crenichthys baileyi]|uniref:Uncharacterized protein n=1 Tax=Crenichthys baileyi TaxID=28760 RepID=A0AAV9RCZ4_9TELE